MYRRLDLVAKGLRPKSIYNEKEFRSFVNMLHRPMYPLSNNIRETKLVNSIFNRPFDTRYKESDKNK